MTDKPDSKAGADEALREAIRLAEAEASRVWSDYLDTKADAAAAIEAAQRLTAKAAKLQDKAAHATAVAKALRVAERTGFISAEVAAEAYEPQRLKLGANFRTIPLDENERGANGGGR